MLDSLVSDVPIAQLKAFQLGQLSACIKYSGMCKPLDMIREREWHIMEMVPSEK